MSALDYYRWMMKLVDIDDIKQIFMEGINLGHGEMIRIYLMPIDGMYSKLHGKLICIRIKQIHDTKSQGTQQQVLSLMYA
mmetsp:Transcript_24321/g.57247  ORF Transcript_24321/g.57247 Transcript_24321/m.57247 type:complete len:80 (+) Transcript_24321:738-977(+)